MISHLLFFDPNNTPIKSQNLDGAVNISPHDGAVPIFAYTVTFPEEPRTPDSADRFQAGDTLQLYGGSLVGGLGWRHYVTPWGWVSANSTTISHAIAFGENNDPVSVINFDGKSDDPKGSATLALAFQRQDGRVLEIHEGPAHRRLTFF